MDARVGCRDGPKSRFDYSSLCPRPVTDYSTAAYIFRRGGRRVSNLPFQIVATPFSFNFSKVRLTCAPVMLRASAMCLRRSAEIVQFLWRTWSKGGSLLF